MVDLLAAEGNVAAAGALDELWCELAEQRDFSLLCGYRLDVFDRDTQAGILPEICRTHSHVLPARNDPRLAGAVDRALNEMLGREEADRIYQRLSIEPAGAEIPMAQRILMWISENRPASSPRILANARAHYQSPG